MANNASRFFLNLMTSGKRLDAKNEATRDQRVRYIMLNAVIFLGCTMLTTFGIESLRSGLSLQGIFDLILAGMTVITFLVLRTNAPYAITAFLGLFPYLCLYAFLAQSGGIQGSGVLWVFSFPLLAIFLLGMRRGVILSLVLLGLLGVFLFVPGAAAMSFHSSFALRTVGVYVLVLACTIIYEQTKTSKDTWLAKLNRTVRAERDEIAVMKDNLKAGLFLMNREYRIQPQYSRALEGILGQGDLAGKSFPDFLASSLTPKERDTLIDYFDMVFKRSFDAAMLEEINPLHEFTYVPLPGGTEKSLRCSFAPIDRDDGQVYLLATVEDQSREISLMRQLSEEEGKRQEEMNALFEVIHVQPRILNDFIDDAEHGFQRINAIMKDQSLGSRQVLVECYQAVHAIKSNALILGLQGFGDKLHLLEEKLGQLRQKAEPGFQDMLHLTVELDKLQKIKDGFKDIIAKIMSFNQDASRLQESAVLVQTLERVVDKTASQLGKKARLVIGELQAEALERGPRRLMKEILVQLVRNAMYHGIELPARRLDQNKPEMGDISLSIALREDTIHIQLGDDGQGLNYAAIHQKAVSQGLIDAQVQPGDRAALLKALFSPGFSTVDQADQYAGRGMGLSLVREMVKEARGAIKVQSSDAKGCLFKLSIPV